MSGNSSKPDSEMMKRAVHAITRRKFMIGAAAGSAAIAAGITSQRIAYAGPLDIINDSTKWKSRDNCRNTFRLMYDIQIGELFTDPNVWDRIKGTIDDRIPEPQHRGPMHGFTQAASSKSKSLRDLYSSHKWPDAVKDACTSQLRMHYMLPFYYLFGAERDAAANFLKDDGDFLGVFGDTTLFDAFMRTRENNNDSKKRVDLLLEGKRLGVLRLHPSEDVLEGRFLKTLETQKGHCARFLGNNAWECEVRYENDMCITDNGIPTEGCDICS